MCRISHHTRDYSLYASWVASLVVLLASYDSYSYLKPKRSHDSEYIYIRKSEKGKTKKDDVQMKKCFT